MAHTQCEQKYYKIIFSHHKRKSHTIQKKMIAMDKEMKPCKSCLLGFHTRRVKKEFALEGTYFV